MSTTREVWSARVRSWQASGTSAESFSEAHGLNPGTLRHWSWRLKKEGVAIAPSPTPGVQFAPVRRMVPEETTPLAPRPTPAAPIVVHVGAARVEITGTFDAGVFGRILDVLEARGGAR